MPLGVVERLEQLNRALDFLLAVERLNFRSVRRPMGVEIAGVLALNVQTVLEHHGGQVGRRRCAEDGAAVAGPKEAGQVAAVINVGVRKHHAVEFLRLTTEAGIFSAGLGPMTLEQAAVEQQAQRVGLDQVLAARDLAGRAVKCDFQSVGFLLVGMRPATRRGRRTRQFLCDSCPGDQLFRAGRGGGERRCGRRSGGRRRRRPGRGRRRGARRLQRVDHQHAGPANERDICEIKDGPVKRAEREEQKVADSQHRAAVLVDAMRQADAVVEIAERPAQNEREGDRQPPAARPESRRAMSECRRRPLRSAPRKARCSLARRPTAHRG